MQVDANVDPRQRKGWRQRKKFPRPPPSSRPQPVSKDNQAEEQGDPIGDEAEGSGQQRSSRKHHASPSSSGQRIVQPREENDAPMIVVPQTNADDEADEYQYHSEELHTPPASNLEEEPGVFSST
ncbi:hypothetical protein PIB30_078408 [Stylosanthes scabra]|uniref:Uncharacterized protein n=1 Tax=Stylosanthes scabra TaxID=79078 RepID=A0ABU6YPW5_9FABA|nr:hypothetical protein [Stylosanthes scabra]